jgi:hypothetical protein
MTLPATDLVPSETVPGESPPSLLVVLYQDEEIDFTFTLLLRNALEIADRLLVLYRNAYTESILPVIPTENGEQIRRFHYGSPLEFVAPLTMAMSAVSGFAALIYALKRVWGLDLELRTHRERLRREFTEAQALAREAEKRFSETPPFHAEVYDAVDILEQHALTSGWAAQEAIVFDQDDPANEG